MRWAERRIPVPAEVVWDILTDVDRWPEWGPTVRRAHLDAEWLAPGATGWVETPVRVRLPFRITEVEAGRRSTWRVAVPATDHRVEPLVPGVGACCGSACRRQPCPT